ncbi:MAG: M90 family metallopeptidase [Pseudomonadota bacterium]
MEALTWITLIAATAIAALWLPRWRLARRLAQPMPDDQLAILRRNLPLYARMPRALQEQVQRLVTQFLLQKKFVGCEGLDVTDEMRVTIAGQASLLLLNRPSKVYPALHTILVYPSAFLVPRRDIDGAGVVTQTRQGLLGESWSDGRVVLSWDHVLRGALAPASGQNVVLHEFAHQLDSESGANNGAPFLGDRARYRRWSQVLARDFARLRHEAMVQQHSVLDHYGANSPAEFFAVATETFFGKPWQMAERHGELFAQFQDYYRVDPRAWLPAPVVELPPDYSVAYGQWQ